MPVPANNNARVFEFINSVGTDWTLAIASNRHIESVADEHKMVICEVSPSRWQKIHGIADTRPEYAKDAGSDSMAVTIWNLMQTLGSQELETLEIPDDKSS
ncbi:hypothetical protein HZB78_02170 [Candidatus Collierbacteria bacterium]|nr:hypothetical protein [Candidatus Collierbacteria bacterium]